MRLAPLSPLSRLLSDHPLLRVVLPLMVGIWIGEAFYSFLSGCFGSLLLAALLFFAVSLCFSVFRKAVVWQSLSFLFSLSVALCLTGMSLLVSARDAISTSWPNEAICCRVQVVEQPRHTGKVVQAVVKILEGMERGRTVRLALAGPEGERLQPGDVLLFRARVEAPRNAGNPGEFDYTAWLRRQGVSGTAYCAERDWQRSVLPQPMPLRVRMLRWRRQLVEIYKRHFQSRDLAVMSALTLGDKTLLDAPTRQLFSQGGVSHVLALSGLHLGILFSLYHFLVLAPCRRRWAYVLLSLAGVCGLWGFALLAGLPLSLVRAAVMFSAMQLSGLLRHDTFSVNNLALAALLILLCWPQALFDVGFQLSCLSVLSILLFVPRLPRPSFLLGNRLSRGLFSLLSVSLCAQLCTTPLVAFYFHAFPVYGLLANLLVVPMAYVLVAGGVCFFLLPFLRPLLAVVLGFVLQSMAAVLEFVASLPGAVLTFYPTPMETFLCYLAMFLAVAYAAGRRPRVLYALCAAVAFWGGVVLYGNRSGRVTPRIVFYNLRTAAAVHCFSSADVSFLWVSDSARAAEALSYIRRDYWEREGCRPPVLLGQVADFPEIYCDGELLSFAGKRLVLLTGKLPPTPPVQPLPVDYLLFARGTRVGLAAALRFYRPACIVADASLPQYQREKLLEEARRSGLAVYDMRRDGALVVPL